MDVSQYLEIFVDETKEHIQNLNTQILELEINPDNEATIADIFRAAHSLKGMAGTMGYKRMQNLTHDMENVFSEVRNGTIKVNSDILDVLFKCIDALEEYLANIQATTEEGSNDNADLIAQLNRILKGGEVVEDKIVIDNVADEFETSDNEETDAAWKQIRPDEVQTNVIREAIKQGKNVYGITVEIQKNCILKAARAFLVFKAIEERGEIVISYPHVQDIEDEKFELSFSLVCVTSENLDKIIADAAYVSEIAKVVGGEFDIDNILPNDEEEDDDEEDNEDVVRVDNHIQEVDIITNTAVVKPNTVKKDGNKKDDKKAIGKPAVNRTVRVDIEKLDTLMNLVSELIIAKNSLVSAATTEGSGTVRVSEKIEYLESVTTNLHESVMKVRMVPIESVLNKFPRMVRDLQKKLDKKMELIMTGEDTELDRTVVDEIGDPLMHLLRNSADHGIEARDVRLERGKSEVGTINLDAYQDGNNVVIEVTDDGNGIDVDVVRNKAIERGVITEEQADAMTEKEIVNLLFLPAFSTAKVVSDVSGRGVGLDVVRSKIEALSGEVEVKTKLGEGSVWTIRLPLTLAIIQVLMVEVGGEKYAISLGAIQTIENIPPSEIKLVQSKEVIQLRGSVVPLVRLSEVLDIESNRTPEDDLIVVIVKKGDRYAGLVIDSLMGQQEIVIKSLGKYINKCRIISGATILGDGEVALILDANALV